jgi:hypothetical protein
MGRKVHYVRKSRQTVKHIGILPVALSFGLGAAAFVFAPKAWTQHLFSAFELFTGASLTAVFASCAIFDIMVLLSATSTLGTVLIPAEMFICGGCVAERSATIISGFTTSDILKVLLGTAVPAFLIIPPLFALCRDGMDISKRLSTGCDRKQRLAAVKNFAANFALAAALCAAASAYIYYLLPGITT